MNCDHITKSTKAMQSAKKECIVVTRRSYGFFVVALYISIQLQISN